MKHLSVTGSKNHIVKNIEQTIEQSKQGAQSSEAMTQIIDRKGKSRKLRLIKNTLGRTREVITADIIEVGGTVNKNIVATLSS